MPEPSLSELTNINSDPGLGTGGPAVLLNNMDLVHIINQNAQFAAQNKWQKYTNFQKNLKEIYQDAASIADIETLEADKPQLKERMGKVLKQIQENPHAFFSGNGAQFAELNGELAKIRADAVASKQNNLFDKAHREFILRDPSLNTEANRKLIDNYTKQPLGKRQAYMLDLPGMFDPATLGKQINELTKSVKPYTEFVGDGKFIESGTETTYDATKWNQIAESMYNMPDERGNMLRNTIQQRFDQLPKEVQEQYADQPDPAKAFYLTSLEPFRMQASKVPKGAPKENQFLLQQQKAQDKLDEMKQKHKYDVSLELLKTSDKKSVDAAKEKLKGKTKNQQFGYLNRLVDNQVNSAIADRTKMVSNPLGGEIPMFKMEVSPPVLHTFGYSTGSGIMKETTDADDMYTDADGKNVAVVFFKREGKENRIVRDKEGNPLIDKSKTKQFSKNEYKGIVGKELLGVSGSLKSLNSSDEENEDDEEDDSDDQESPPPTQGPDLKSLQKKYNY